MKDNKHPHHDLIDQWLMNMNTRFQSGIGNNPSWSGCGISNLIADVEGEIVFRIKPREFVKGHWYPCVDEDGDRAIYIYTGRGFKMYIEQGGQSDPENLEFIGESLGEINFI